MKTLREYDTRELECSLKDCKLSSYQNDFGMMFKHNDKEELEISLFELSRLDTHSEDLIFYHFVHPWLFKIHPNLDLMV